MAALTVTLTNICAGQNHLTFGITGDATATVHSLLTDISDPLTTDDATSFCRIIAKMAKLGRTNAQAKTLLQAGVTVTV